ncbi:hypothetical protein HanRHA438_Chr03g0144041 [Helianthus annuus]|nr:hypothetical protein HanRHA438_Chr03g0144041 [Helianthus annuus]
MHLSLCLINHRDGNDSSITLTLAFILRRAELIWLFVFFFIDGMEHNSCPIGAGVVLTLQPHSRSLLFFEVNLKTTILGVFLKFTF